MVESVVGVDPHSSGLERVGDLDGGVEVGGVHGSSKTIVGVVADLDGVLLVLELGDGADGAENLLLHNLHVFSHVAEDGGLNEEALVTDTLATGLDSGTGLLSFLDVSEIC